MFLDNHIADIWRCHMMRLPLLFTFFLGLVSCALAQAGEERIEVVYNLRSQWHVWGGATWQPAAENTAHRAIHFLVDARQWPGCYLRISQFRPFSVFINRQVLLNNTNQRYAMWSIDSLAKVYGKHWQVGVITSGDGRATETHIVRTAPQVAFDVQLRPGRYFLDFSLVSFFVLVFFGLALLLSNPKLTQDYFNVIQLFSLKERDENLVNTRVASSVNILFYVFLSAWLAYVLLIVFRYALPHVPLAQQFQPQSFAACMARWGLLTGLLLGLLLLKLLLLTMLAELFRLREGFTLQAFNYLRVVTFVNVALSVSALLFFTIGVRSSIAYYRLLLLLAGIILLWPALAFLKLLNRSAFRVFHLFSYLCATEIFPIVALLNVLLS